VRIAAKKGLIKEKNGQIIDGKSVTSSMTGQHDLTVFSENCRTGKAAA
jgi:hypothetical protein